MNTDLIRIVDGIALVPEPQTVALLLGLLVALCLTKLGRKKHQD